MYGNEGVVGYQSGARQECSDGRVPRQPRIAEDMEVLATHIASLADRIGMLLKTIDPILRPSAPDAAGRLASGVDPSSRCPFGNQVCDLSDRLGAIEGMLADAMARVAL